MTLVPRRAMYRRLGPQMRDPCRAVPPRQASCGVVAAGEIADTRVGLERLAQGYLVTDHCPGRKVSDPRLHGNRRALPQLVR